MLMQGNIIAKEMRAKMTEEVKILKQSGITPGLAVVIVGDDPASRIYVDYKKKACADCGIYSEEHALPADIDEHTLLHLIAKLNDDDNIHGILCQLPLPKHLKAKTVIDAIDYHKDVDAFHPINVGRVMQGDFEILPCTPAGVMKILDYYNIDIEGKHCVVLGRSNIVGKPQAMLLLHRNATVTMCHSKTQDLAEITRKADILVSAMGKSKFVTADMIKEGAVVIDVGISRMANGKVSGDIDFDAVSQKASYITPVPGGVGPMTITMLLYNTVEACKMQTGVYCK